MGEGPDVPPIQEKERHARSTPPRVLSRKEKGQHLMYCTAGEDVLEERKDEIVGLWTQTLLARDVLDGWSGLRP